MRRPRAGTIVLLVWTALIAIWVIAGASDANCKGDEACQAGTGIGIGLILFLWVIGLVAIGMIVLIVRLGKRDR